MRPGGSAGRVAINADLTLDQRETLTGGEGTVECIDGAIVRRPLCTVKYEFAVSYGVNIDHAEYCIVRRG